MLSDSRKSTVIASGAYDCANTAAHLAATGKADRGRVAIWRAGEFTVLRALTLTDISATGIARSPVVDPGHLPQSNPKFQAHQMDGLIGPGSTSRECSALHEASVIKRPVLILHCEDDPVTPIQEPRALANALGAHARLITSPR